MPTVKNAMKLTRLILMASALPLVRGIILAGDGASMQDSRNSPFVPISHRAAIASFPEILCRYMTWGNHRVEPEAEVVELSSAETSFLKAFAENFFSPGGLILVSLPATSQWATRVVRTFHDAALWPLLVTGTHESRGRTLEAPEALGGPWGSHALTHGEACILLGSLADMRASITSLRASPFWKADARMLAILLSTAGSKDDAVNSVRDMLTFFWQVSAANVVGVVRRQPPPPGPGGRAGAGSRTLLGEGGGGGFRLDLYTSFPYAASFGSGRCGRGDIGRTLTHLGGLSPAKDFPNEIRSFLGRISPYPEKIPRDFQGCTLRASISAVRPHPEQHTVRNRTLQTFLSTNIFKAAADLWNFSTDYVVSTRSAVSSAGLVNDASEVYPNGSFVDRLSTLQRDEVDVVLGVYTITTQRLAVLKPTSPFQMGRVRIILRCSWSPSEVASGVLSAVRARLPLLTFLFAGMVCTVLAFHCLSASAREPSPSSWTPAYSLRESALLMWSAFTEVVVVAQGQPRELRLRLVFLSFLLFVLNVNVPIKGALTASSTAPASSGRVQTLAQLARAGVTVGYPSMSHLETLQEMGFTPNKMVLCRDVPRCMRRMERDDEFCLVLPTLVRLNWRQVRGCHYTLRPAVKWSPHVFYTQKWFPPARCLDQTILRLHQGGLVKHWINLYKTNRQVYGRRRDRPNLLNVAFICLAVGLATATGALVAEKVWQ